MCAFYSCASFFLSMCSNLVHVPILDSLLRWLSRCLTCQGENYTRQAAMAKLAASEAATMISHQVPFPLFVRVPLLRIPLLRIPLPLSCSWSIPLIRILTPGHPGAWGHGLRVGHAGRAPLPRCPHNRDLRGHKVCWACDRLLTTAKSNAW
jgi:hypothetical protein